MNTSVIKYIKQEFSGAQEFEELNKGFFKFVWTPGLTAAAVGSGRTQTIWLFVRENTVVIASPFTEVGVVDPEEAVSWASRTLLGLQAAFDHYCLVHVLDSKRVSEDLYFWVESVATAADDLDAAIHGDDSF